MNTHTDQTQLSVQESHHADTPPVFASWSAWYWLSAGCLLAYILVCMWVKQAFGIL